MTENLKHRAVSAATWHMAEMLTARFGQFIVGIVLARILLPEQFGLIATLMVFLQLANVFVLGGFGQALIQRKETTLLEESSVFYCNITIAWAVYALLFFVAPGIAGFYGKPILVPLLRVAALSVIAGSGGQVHATLLRKRLRFKPLFVMNVIAVSVSSVVGIWMALVGWGAFSLAWQMVAMWATRTVCLWTLSPWRPKRQFSFAALKPLFLFGWKLVASSLLATFFQNLYQIIIPKLFSQTALGYFDRGLKLPQLLMTSVNSTLSAVMFPVLSAMQDDCERMRSAIKRSFTVVAFLLWPLMIGLLVMAEPVVRILLTDKWLPAVPYMQVFCFVRALAPIHSGNLQVLTATGHSGLFFLCEVLKRIVNVLAIVLTYQHGLYAMVLALIPGTFVMLVINCMFSGHFIRYPAWRQLYDLLPVATITAMMAAIVYGVSRIPIESLYLSFALQVIASVTSYLAMAHMLQITAYKEVRTLITEKLAARRSA